MRRGRLEDTFDDALLAVAMSSGALYARRRMRRATRALGRGAALLTAGAVAVTVLGAAGAVAARRRRSS